MEIDPKELALVKREASAAEKLAATITIQSSDDLEAAASVLSKVKTSQRIIKEEKEKITKPLNAGLAAARAFFKPFEDAVDKAEELIKGKMMQFRRLEAVRIEKREEKVIERLDKGSIKPERAVAIIEAMQQPTRVQSDGGAKVLFRKVRVVHVDDEQKVPRAYLVLDMVKIRRDALDGKVIPGVSVVEEEQPAAS